MTVPATKLSDSPVKLDRPWGPIDVKNVHNDQSWRICSFWASKGSGRDHKWPHTRDFNFSLFSLSFTDKKKNLTGEWCHSWDAIEGSSLGLQFLLEPGSITVKYVMTRLYVTNMSVAKDTPRGVQWKRKEVSSDDLQWSKREKTENC